MLLAAKLLRAFLDAIHDVMPQCEQPGEVCTPVVRGALYCVLLHLVVKVRPARNFRSSKCTSAGSAEANRLSLLLELLEHPRVLNCFADPKVIHLKPAPT